MAEYIEREDAKKALIGWDTDPTDEEIEYAINNIPSADVVSQAVFEQVKWERDTALATLKEHGIGLAEKADVVEVVRCKDCLYWQDNNGSYPHPECRWGLGETPDAEDFCSYGERRSI